jgi:hypothetical protein
MNRVTVATCGLVLIASAALADGIDPQGKFLVGEYTCQGACNPGPIHVIWKNDHPWFEQREGNNKKFFEGTYNSTAETVYVSGLGGNGITGYVKPQMVPIEIQWGNTGTTWVKGQ